jgi:Protein of unknown function (DUF1186)/SEC-C motif
MDVERILHELSQQGPLPTEAILAAREKREALVPRFIEAFERYTDDPGHEPPDLLFMAFHLLGEWHERSSYRPLVRFLRSRPEDVERALGDATTETANRVMAQVFDGDPQPLYALILDPAADEYIRSEMCETLAVVTLRGNMPREEIIRFLRACFDDLKDEKECFVWSGWLAAVAMLGLEDFTPLANAVFDGERITSGVMEFRHFEEDLQRASNHPDSPWPKNSKARDPWTDTIAELSTWYAFSDKHLEEQRTGRRIPTEKRWMPDWGALWTQAPAVNVHRDVGRNDPCPCGSGLKFKKCCLQSAA